MRKFFLFYLLFGTFILNAQTSKHTIPIKYDDLKFYSDFEKQQFQNITINNAQIDYFQLFVSIDSSQTIVSANNLKSKLNEIYENLNKQKLAEKSLKKATKIIFNNVHSVRLIQYIDNVNFDKIFINGKYNCLTASALYALIFEKYNIPYSIKELPSHVFVVVDPNNEQIQIETTDPTAGYRIFDEKDKTAFVDYLKTSKIVSKEDITNSSVNQLFEKYFYNESNISLKQLAGLAYFNDALQKYEAEDKWNCLLQLEKSYFLNPSEKIGYFLNLACKEICYDVYLSKDFKNLGAFAKYANYEGENCHELVLEEVDKMARDLILNNDKASQYEEYSNVLQSQIKDSALISAIKEKKGLQLGYHYFLKNNYMKSISKLMEAYYVNQSNLQVKQYLKQSLHFYIAESNLEQGAILDTLENLKIKYPTLKNDVVINSYILWFNLKNMGDNFRDNNIKSALQYLDKVDKIIDKKYINNDDDNALSYAYSEASSYYVRQENITKAKYFLNKGLEFLPNDRTLTYKLDLLIKNR